MKKVFKYNVAYKCNTAKDCDELREQLEKIGYIWKDDNTSNQITECKYNYLINSYDKLGHLGLVASNWNSVTESYLCGSKELFLGLASMVDSEEFYEGEYVIRIEDSHCGMKVGDIDRITKVNYQDSIILTKYSLGLIGGHLGKNLRKATKEEIIKLFTKEVKSQEENQMKKLIGYKLIKPEYEQAAAKITDYTGTCGFVQWMMTSPNGGFASKLKNAGVLDLWFEPVYKEVIPEYVKCINWGNGFSHKDGVFYKVNNGMIDCEKEGTPSSYSKHKQYFIPATKEEYEAYQESIKPKLEVGRWYYVDKDQFLINYQGFHNRNFGFNIYGNWSNSVGFAEKDIFRLASESEVKSALISEAKKRYKNGDVFMSAYYKTVIADGIFNNNPKYNFYQDGLECISTKTTRSVYYKGKWAEVISSIPEYKVGEYVEYVTTEGDGSGSYFEIGTKSQFIRIDGLAWNSKYSGLPDDSTDFYSDNLELNLSFEGIKRKVTKDEYIKSVIPNIEINGYKAKFGKDIVGFGCNDIQVDFIKEIYRLQSIGIDLTKESSKIKQIADYYKNK